MNKPFQILSMFLALMVSATLTPHSAQTQTRHVEGQILTSTSLPSIRIRFDKPFKYLGSQNFILYDRANVEQHFFVDADKQQRIERMYMLQFEGYLPGITAAYNYPVTKTVDLAGQSYIASADIVSDVQAALNQNPQSDAGHAASFLKSKGFNIGNAIMFQRFVRLVDEAKRNEFILLYIEELKDRNLEQRDELLRDLSTRALKGFAIVK